MEDPPSETEIERNGAEVQIEAKPGGGADNPNSYLYWFSSRGSTRRKIRVDIGLDFPEEGTAFWIFRWVSSIDLVGPLKLTRLGNEF